ncbi:hypothetical protein DENIS_4685 [Desulfonema ishimotonii]|uniref:Uncharacterized protein n=1 Tax=Desulfonema ishimotonii TaxID=45657 RepID=A0A401G373_9BACT|nr:hypothetical protein [Desulfonema ishimotonii]GBC63687.1 hypothetical protein DENIS_4685 [Desulfonema ishimotonii]
MKKLNHENLRKVLATTYMEKEKAGMGDGWQSEVMRQVRIPEATATDMHFELFSRFVWRFAATACVFAVLLSAYAFQNGFQTEYELAQLLIGDPLGFSLAQSFGVL